MNVPRHGHPPRVGQRVGGVGGLGAVRADDDHVGHVAAAALLVYGLRLLALLRRRRRRFNQYDAARVCVTTTPAYTTFGASGTVVKL